MAMSKTDIGNAHHEAGHAVAATLFGIRLIGVDITPQFTPTGPGSVASPLPNAQTVTPWMTATLRFKLPAWRSNTMLRWGGKLQRLA